MCAITVAGSAYCWGAFIRLSSTPWLVVTPQRFVAVSVGNGSAYGLTERGVLFAWGNNSRGQLGDGTVSSSEVPVRVLDPP